MKSHRLSGGATESVTILETEVHRKVSARSQGRRCAVTLDSLLGACWQSLASLACRHTTQTSAFVLLWPALRISVTFPSLRYNTRHTQLEGGEVYFDLCFQSMASWLQTEARSRMAEGHDGGKGTPSKVTRKQRGRGGA